MYEMTASNLRSAFGGESMAHMRYKIWAEQAEIEGFANVGRLFRAIAAAEQVHATGHFKVLGEIPGGFPVLAGGGFGLGTTLDNIIAALDGELFEVEEMYPAFIAVAQTQGETNAVTSMEYAAAAEKNHATLFKQAMQAVEAGQDMDVGPINVCRICGCTVEGNIPDQCPICSADKDKFATFA